MYEGSTPSALTYLSTTERVAGASRPSAKCPKLVIPSTISGGSDRLLDWSVVVSLAISGIFDLRPSWLHWVRKCTASAPTISTNSASGAAAWTREMYGE